MYKVQIALLKKVTKILDSVHEGAQTVKEIKERRKEAGKLSKYIKNNYTEIKT